VNSAKDDMMISDN